MAKPQSTDETPLRLSMDVERNQGTHEADDITNTPGRSGTLIHLIDLVHAYIHIPDALHSSLRYFVYSIFPCDRHLPTVLHRLFF